MILTWLQLYMNNSSITQNTEEYYFATPVNAIIEVILATPPYHHHSHQHRLSFQLIISDMSYKIRQHHFHFRSLYSLFQKFHHAHYSLMINRQQRWSKNKDKFFPISSSNEHISAKYWILCYYLQMCCKTKRAVLYLKNFLRTSFYEP